MTIDGVERAPLVTDYERWRRLVFQGTSVMTFQRMDETLASYPAKLDANARTIALTNPADKIWGARFAFNRRDPQHLAIDGDMDGHTVHMDLQLFDHTKLLLVSRGFNWIQEYPFNR